MFCLAVVSIRRCEKVELIAVGSDLDVLFCNLVFRADRTVINYCELEFIGMNNSGVSLVSFCDHKLEFFEFNRGELVVACQVYRQCCAIVSRTNN